MMFRAHAPILSFSLLLPLAAALAFGLGIAACGSDDAENGGPGGTGVPSGSAGGVVSTTEVPLPPQDEVVRVAYTRQRRGGEATDVQLVVTDTDCRRGDCPDGGTIVGGFDFNCNNHTCRITDTASHVVFRDAAQASRVLFAPLDDDLQLTGDGQEITPTASRIAIGGTRVAYRSGDQLGVFDMASGQRFDLGELTSTVANARGGGFHIAPEGDRLVRYVFTNTTLHVSMVDLDAGSETRIYSLLGGAPTGSGSFFNGNEPALITDFEGGFVYLVADAFTLGGACGSNADCAGDAGICLQFSPPRCGEAQTFLTAIYLPDADQLGQSCGTDAECGGVQRCDTSFVNPDTQRGVCAPPRLALGPGGPNRCNFFSAGDFTQVAPMLMERADGRIVALGTSTCRQDVAGANIDWSGLVAADPMLQDSEVILAFDAPVYDFDACYDANNDRITYDTCSFELRRARISPSGGTIVAVGNSPAGLRDDTIWVIDAFGRGTPRDLEPALIPGGGNNFEIEQLQVLR